MRGRENTSEREDRKTREREWGKEGDRKRDMHCTGFSFLLFFVCLLVLLFFCLVSETHIFPN